MNNKDKKVDIETGDKPVTQILLAIVEDV